MKKLIQIGLVAGLAVSLPNLAAADEWEAQVREQLAAAQSYYQSQGYTRVGRFEIDTMTDDEIDNFTVTLAKGVNYHIIGACDLDCSDIDFWLYDEDGNEIDSDISDDDVPVVEVTPQWTGEFRIKVRMYDCGSEPCYHGIVVMQD